MTLDEYRNKLRRMGDRLMANAIARLYQATVAVQRASQYLCPVKTGNLRRSAYTTKPAHYGSRIECVVGYTANYAIYVHENMRARHAPPTRAKFLEIPLQRLAPRFDEVIMGTVEPEAVLEFGAL